MAGTQTKSHNGFAGGGWRNKDQILKLESDEYVKRVDGHHITKGNVRDQLSKVSYTTNKDRIISCFNKKVKYSTEKKTFLADEGKFISMINQYEDPKKCCGRITSVTQETLAVSLTEALDTAFAATCQNN